MIMIPPLESDDMTPSRFLLAVLARAPARQRVVLSLLTLALLLTTITDSAFAYLTAADRYATGNLIDIGWAAALVVFTVAALASRTTPPPVAPACPSASSSSSSVGVLDLVLRRARRTATIPSRSSPGSLSRSTSLRPAG